MKISTATEPRIAPKALDAPARKTPLKTAAVSLIDSEARADHGRKAVASKRVAAGDAPATVRGPRLDRSPQLVARSYAAETTAKAAKTEQVAAKSKEPSAHTVTMQKEAQLVLDALLAKELAGEYSGNIPRSVCFGNAEGRQAVLCALGVAEKASKDAGIKETDVVGRYVNWAGQWRADLPTQRVTKALKAYLKQDERATIDRGYSPSQVLQLSPTQRLKEAHLAVPKDFVRLTPELLEKKVRELFGSSGPKDGATFEIGGQQATVRYSEAAKPQEPDYRKIGRNGGDVQAAHSNWIGVGGGLQALYSGDRDGSLTIEVQSANGKWSRFSGYASFYRHETFGRDDSFYTEQHRDWSYKITEKNY